MTISDTRKNNLTPMHKDKQFEAIVLGGTGGVGAHLVNILLKSPLYSTITVISRKSIPHDPKLNLIIWNDFSEALLIHPEKAIKVFKNHHVVFCCLGASESALIGLLFNPKKYAKRFETVDYDYVVGAATAAHHAGVPYFSVISSAKANPKAKFLMLKIKGNMEIALQDINFRGLSIFRPSSLMKPAHGNERYLKRMSKNLIALISRMLPFEQKAIFVEDVAKAMKKEFEIRITKQKEGVSFLQSDCMRNLLAKQ